MLVGLIGYSQESMLEVASFSLEENSLTAKNEPVRDTNNQKCALVIISGFGNESLRFNVGNTFSKVEEKRDDRGKRVYLLWIPEGTVKVTISSDSKSFAPVEYFFNPRVKKAETYLMNLKVDKNNSSINKQYLEFSINSKDAILEVNNDLWPLNDGLAYRQVPKGKYYYQVKAKDYHTETGIIDFSDLSTKQTISINLRPNFGWLTINNPNANTTILIDDEPFTGNLEHIRLSSGKHTIKAVKELYQSFEQDIVIEDNKETTLPIELNPNFSTVTIFIAEGADIYIDDKFEGKNSWTGRLQKGSYKIELKKENHNSLCETILVKNVGENLKFNYRPLYPILSSVSIESNPPKAKVLIDGKDYGTTPILVPELIIGEHNISLSLSGYNTLYNKFELVQDNESNLSYDLEKTPDKEENTFTVKTKPTGASVYVESVCIGKTPCFFKLYNNYNYKMNIILDGYEVVNMDISNKLKIKDLEFDLKKK